MLTTNELHDLLETSRRGRVYLASDRLQQLITELVEARESLMFARKTINKMRATRDSHMEFLKREVAREHRRAEEAEKALVEMKRNQIGVVDGESVFRRRR